jgi:hypothetical protein
MTVEGDFEDDEVEAEEEGVEDEGYTSDELDEDLEEGDE